MAKEMDEIQEELEQLRVSLERLRARVPNYSQWSLLIQATNLFHIVLVRRPPAWRLSDVPEHSGRAADHHQQHGPTRHVELKWGTDVIPGEVQQQSTRVVQPPTWPAEICNTGSVPLTVCPS